MALTLLRHGPLPLAHQNRYNGWTDIPIDTQLFDLALKENTKTSALKERHFDFVFTSDLSRCTDTLDRLGITEYKKEVKLREVAFKPQIEGCSFDEVSKLPEFNPKFLQNEKVWHHFVCLESIETFENRIKDFLANLPKEKEILICSHAGTLREIMRQLGQEPLTLRTLEYLRCPV